MSKLATTLLLLTALVLPVALLWLLLSHSHLSGLVAAAIAVVAGWALNVAWAYAMKSAPPADPPQAHGDTFAIAARFGWACPLILVLVAWLVWHFTTGGAA